MDPAVIGEDSVVEDLPGLGDEIAADMT